MSGSMILAGAGAAATAFQPGAGGPLPATLDVQWIGPFTPGEARFPQTVRVTTVIPSQAVLVTTVQMLALPPSDVNWWEIVP